jgi:sulfite exporter TauE/SafE
VPGRRGMTWDIMGIGTSIFLIAVGAILRFAVSATTSGVNIHTVGVILIIVGAIGLVISLLYMLIWSDRNRGTAPVARERYVERDPMV